MVFALALLLTETKTYSWDKKSLSLGDQSSFLSEVVGADNAVVHLNYVQISFMWSWA